MRNLKRALLAVLLSSAVSSGQTLVSHLVLSGDGSDQPTVIATDNNGFVYVAGSTTSGNFPVTNALQSRPSQSALQVSVNGAAFANSSLTASLVGAVAGSSDGTLVLASTPNGIVRSTDQGVTWTATATALPLCAALAVDPVNPSIAYALLLNTSTLYKSTNGGVNWQATGASFPSVDTVTRIAINPQNDAILYLFAGGQVYRSTNAGQAWQALVIPTVGSMQVQAFAMAPSQPNVLYVSGSSIFRSADGGSTWTGGAEVYAAAATAIAVDPTNASTVWVADNVVNVQKSTDGGVTFQTVATFDNTNPNGNPFASVAIDPANSSHVYVSTTYNIYETSDGGQTWSRVGGSAWGVYAAPSRIYTMGGSVAKTVFLTKVDAAVAQVIYSTYLWTGTVTAIAVDSSGNVYLAGSDATGSNGVVMKVSASDNSVLYSKPIAGAVPNAIAIDSSGNAVVAGAATALPATTGAYQATIPGPCGLIGNPTDAFPTQEFTHAFVAKLSPSGALVAASYLTGSCGDSAFAVALDSTGNIYVGGQTYSTDFPVTTKAMIPTFPATYSSGFIAELSPTGNRLLYSSFVGGGNFNSVHVVQLVGDNVYLAGSTGAAATNGDAHVVLPLFCQRGIGIGGPSLTPPPPGDNPFVMKTTLSGTPPAFLATVGGSCRGEADSLALDSAGNIWLSGSSMSWDFPPVAPIGGLADTPPNYLYNIGGSTGFLAELNPSGSALLSSTVTDSFGAVAADSTAVYYTGGLADLNPAGLPTGNYGALVARINPTPTASIFIDAITQLNSPSPSPAAPGEVVLIVGRGIGPQDTAPGKFTATGSVATSTGGVTVTFNGVPAPILWAHTNQIEVVTPFEVNGLTSAAVQVQYNGQTSNAYTVSVLPQNPEILFVANSDWSANSPTNPAKPGSLATIFLTGLGQTIPAGIDGAVNVPPLAQLAVVPQVTFNGGNYTGTLAYIGAAAGDVSGVSQMNIVVGSTLVTSVNLQSFVEVDIVAGFGHEVAIYVAP